VFGSLRLVVLVAYNDLSSPTSAELGAEVEDGSHSVRKTYAIVRAIVDVRMAGDANLVGFVNAYLD